MNLKEIKELIKLMNDNQLGEVEVEHEGSKVVLKKLGAGVPMAISSAPMMMPPQVLPGSSASPDQEVKSTRSANAIEIVSPMVGTFYRAPAPDADPYVQVGQVVEPGQVVCIVEAMKLMNEIKAEARGKITEILVENAQPVEFGQTMFVIEPV